MESGVTVIFPLLREGKRVDVVSAGSRERSQGSGGGSRRNSASQSRHRRQATQAAESLETSRNQLG